MNSLHKSNKVFKNLAFQMTLIVWILPAQIFAQGSFNPNINTAICTAAEDQYFPAIIPDGFSGAIIVWRDHRNGNWDIYAQHIDAQGMPQWTANGVAICTEPSHQKDRPHLVSDGAGGAIILWRDERSGNTTADIYAQRIDASGNVQWQTNGVPICTAAGEQSEPMLVSDRAGGAIITWFDERRGYTHKDIYAQRIDAQGAAQKQTCTPYESIPLTGLLQPRRMG